MAHFLKLGVNCLVHFLACHLVELCQIVEVKDKLADCERHFLKLPLTLNILLFGLNEVFRSGLVIRWTVQFYLTLIRLWQVTYANVLHATSVFIIDDNIAVTVVVLEVCADIFLFKCLEVHFLDSQLIINLLDQNLFLTWRSAILWASIWGLAHFHTSIAVY